MKNILLIRFSSFGDIVQSMAVVPKIKKEYPNARISFVTKEQFKEILLLDQNIQNIFALPANKGFFQGIMNLWLLASELKKHDFDIVYDAHQVPRSKLLTCFLKLQGAKFRFIFRSKERLKRILFFKLKMKVFPTPYRGMVSYLDPLFKAQTIQDNKVIHSNWHFNDAILQKVESILRDKKVENKKICVLVPSAAWPMKRWPINHWAELIKITDGFTFIVLGGPQDTFCQKLEEIDPSRVINLAGKLSLAESSYLMTRADVAVSGDTGLIHISDLLNKKAISLIGPTAFGFPSTNAISLLEVDLPCRPCTKDGRGSCKREIYQECMVKITPELVKYKIGEISKPHQ